ncbi:MAG TPA: FtsX-like permease family protein, partial [Enhygromyxa sp.]|nr:FtsX-like permease family protein [Enhygromyxa sp.]
LGSVALALGERGPWLLAGMWLACLTGSVAVLIDRLRPMLVVAVVGLALGVASLFVVLGVASGIERTLVGSLARLNGHAMVNKYGLDFFEYEDVARQLEADARVHAASPFVFGVGALVLVDPDGEPLAGEQSPVVVTIKGVDPQRLARFSAVDELFAVGGLDSLRPADPRVRPGIALGVRLARRIGAEPGSIVRVVVPAEIRQQRDDDARPRHAEFEVLALLDTGFAEFDATFALVHLRAAQAVVFGEARATGVEIELREPRLGAVIPVARELGDRLNQPIVSQGKPPLYRSASWLERSATLTSIRQTKALLVVIVGLIVVVASSSLIGALLLLVRRERRHIGVLAALGARPRQLFAAFELVGVLVGALGSALGLALGSLSLLALSLLRFDLDPDIYMIDHLPVAFVVTDMLVPTGLAIVVCAVVSGPIARQVGKTRPLELLG